MKKLNIIVAFASAVILLSSCASVSVDTKDIKHMGIRFKPLSRADFTLVGNLESTSTVTGKGSSKGKVLDKAYAEHLKKGMIMDRDVHEVMYFAPGQNEAITGSMYENSLFNNVYGPAGVAVKGGLFGGLFAGIKKSVAMADPAMDFAYYDMVKKYPEVDYFINVRFDRKIVINGSRFTETIIVKADGIKLRTDN